MAGDMFVDDGHELVVDLLVAAAWYCQSGTGATGPTASDSALGTAAGPSPGLATDSKVTTTTTGDTFQCVTTLSYTSTLSITECGIFDGATGSGTDSMLQRHVFTSIGVDDGDDIEFTTKLQFKDTSE